MFYDIIILKFAILKIFIDKTELATYNINRKTIILYGQIG